VQPCDTPPSSGQAALGFFRRGARLIAPIPLAPVIGPPPVLVTATASPFGGGGQWVAVSVNDSINDRMWLWKNDLGKAYDLGAGDTWAVHFSPDGRRVVYPRTGAFPLPLAAYDTMTGTTRVLTSNGLPGAFSPDGRKYAFFDKPTFASAADLAVYDFDSDDSVTLAPDVWVSAVLSDDAAFLGGSRAIVFRTFEENVGPAWAPPAPLYAYDFQSGTTRSLGNVVELTAIPGAAFAAYRTDGGPAMLIDATLTPRALPGASIPASSEMGAGYVGFQPTPDGKRLAYTDGDRVFHLVGLDGSADLTLPGVSGCLPDYFPDQWPLENNLANPPRAAKFTSDGRAIVRALGVPCSAGGAADSLARYDLGTGKETVVSLPEVGGLRAFSPLGQAVVQAGLPPFRVWSSPSPLTTLDLPEPDPSGRGGLSNALTFAFTDDGRYLSYTFGALMVHDIAAGTTRQAALISTLGVVAVSQVTGIVVAWVEHYENGGTVLTALKPDGSSLTLDPLYWTILAEPRGTVVAYPMSDEAGDGTVIYRLQQGATPQVVGNGVPLAVSPTQVIFRDLDGVCSYSW
jgi:hypothetical protein